jgi:CHAT domain-containing protein
MMRFLNSWMKFFLPGIILFILPGTASAQPSHSQPESGYIQQNLKPDEVMLEYFLTDSSVLVTAIAVDSTLFASQSLNSLFWVSLKSFQKKLKSADPNEFSIVGQVLYLYLVKPVEDFLAGKRRLIIIPGSRLSGLPFEAFVVNDNSSPPYNICNIHYLIRDYEVVYHCSPVFWCDLAGKNEDEHNCSPDDHQFAFMGFSPVFSNYQGLSALPGSKNEITEIGSLFHQKGLSKWLVSEQYSDKEYFKSVASRGKIVHLATHYIHDDNDPTHEGFLFWGYDFSGGKKTPDNGILSVDEITRLKLRADLIVLNACSSGTEQTKEGDTVSTLPCIFFTAGARNIMSTLWSVNDQLAGNFMICFYRQWLSGKSYSEALREVKLQMIRCPETAMPTIWAPYVLTGH